MRRATMKKIVQIMPWPDGWEAGFLSYDDEELFYEPIFCWALISKRVYIGNGDEEITYLEGLVMAPNGGSITGVFDLPQCTAIRDLRGEIAFVSYRNIKVPEKYRKEETEYFKKVAEDLPRLRSSGHL
jgi:hypothetical protein